MWQAESLFHWERVEYYTRPAWAADSKNQPIFQTNSQITNPDSDYFTPDSADIFLTKPFEIIINVL